MTNNKKTLLITGSTGFIGSHLVKKLVDKYQVIALVSPSDIGVRPLPENASIEYADIGDFDLVKKILSKNQPKIILHLAALSPVRYSFENSGIYQKVNYLATINLVQAAMKIENFEKFVYASTMETYGWQPIKKLFTENLSLHPDSPYAVSKVAAEKYIQMVTRAFNFPAVVLKACNTFGRKNEKGYIVEYIVTEMLKGRNPQLGTPGAVRDLMYIDDHVNGYLKATEFKMPEIKEMNNILEKDPIAFTFNLGNGLEFTMREIAQKIGEIIGFKEEIKTGFPKDYPWRPSTAPYLSLNANKANKLLEWKPKVFLEEGLQKTIEFWKENL